MSEPDYEEKTSPTQILPKKSILDLQEYLDMQSTLADETNFRVLYALKRIGNADLEDLVDVLDEDANQIESSLDELVGAGLATRRMRRTADMDEGEFYTYYLVNSLGEGLLEEGIEHLLQMEWELLKRYS